jgi:hypothetical protein
MIVEEIRNRTPPGRFLKQDSATKLWYDIGEKKALDKTRQALREGAPELTKDSPGEENESLEGDDEDEDDDSSPSPPLQRNLQQHAVPLQQVQQVCTTKRGGLASRMTLGSQMTRSRSCTMSYCLSY